eukprot:TRINITY_DN297_c0_g1_i1.p1 TRINITY_DN297_c0_g1~~TRINITY_DN297_c0_g1_i1.p1  ORF type:complete len:221 (-),score=127.54 TRINITY_DN297_c0_g1_i1:167-829(-)
MAATKAKLTYFGSRGLAEVIRIIAAEAQIEYEEISVGSWHPTDKSDAFKQFVADGVLAFDALPLWEEGSLKLVQSAAIVRHLARTRNLYGANVEEAALCDIVHEGLIDFASTSRAYRNASAENKEQVREQLLTKDWPKFFGQFERLLSKNEEGKGFFVGKQLTFVDLLAWYWLENLCSQPLGLTFNEYPLLKSFKERIESRPRIAAWRTSSARPPLQLYF